MSSNDALGCVALRRSSLPRSRSCFCIFPNFSNFHHSTSVFQWVFISKSSVRLFGAGHHCPCATTASLLQPCSRPGCCGQPCWSIFAFLRKFRDTSLTSRNRRGTKMACQRIKGGVPQISISFAQLWRFAYGQFCLYLKTWCHEICAKREKLTNITGHNIQGENRAGTNLPWSRKGNGDLHQTIEQKTLR